MSSPATCVPQLTGAAGDYIPTSGVTSSPTAGSGSGNQVTAVIGIVATVALLSLLYRAYWYYSHRSRSRGMASMAWLSDAADPSARRIEGPLESLKGTARARISDASPTEVVADTGAATPAAMPPAPRPPSLLARLKSFVRWFSPKQTAAWQPFDAGSSEGSNLSSDHEKADPQPLHAARDGSKNFISRGSAESSGSSGSRPRQAAAGASEKEAPQSAPNHTVSALILCSDFHAIR